jgi:hypothetical protein
LDYAAFIKIRDKMKGKLYLLVSVGSEEYRKKLSKSYVNIQNNEI